MIRAIKDIGLLRLAIAASVVSCLASAWFGILLLESLEKPLSKAEVKVANWWEPTPPIPAHDETPGPGWVQENKNTWRWEGTE